MCNDIDVIGGSDAWWCSAMIGGLDACRCEVDVSVWDT